VPQMRVRLFPSTSSPIPYSLIVTDVQGLSTKYLFRASTPSLSWFTDVPLSSRSLSKFVSADDQGSFCPNDLYRFVCHLSWIANTNNFLSDFLIWFLGGLFNDTSLSETV
jgi:hypothetical protein